MGGMRISTLFACLVANNLEKCEHIVSLTIAISSAANPSTRLEQFAVCRTYDIKIKNRHNFHVCTLLYVGLLAYPIRITRSTYVYAQRPPFEYILYIRWCAPRVSLDLWDGDTLLLVGHQDPVQQVPHLRRQLHSTKATT